jgi:hypothetical protein
MVDPMSILWTGEVYPSEAYPLNTLYRPRYARPFSSSLTLPIPYAELHPTGLPSQR